MTWGTFIVWLFVIYMLYYLTIMLIDIIQLRKFQTAKPGGGRHYDIRGFNDDHHVTNMVTDEGHSILSGNATESGISEDIKNTGAIGGHVQPSGIDLIDIYKAAVEGSVQYTADIAF